MFWEGMGEPKDTRAGEANDFGARAAEGVAGADLHAAACAPSLSRHVVLQYARLQPAPQDMTVGCPQVAQAFVSVPRRRGCESRNAGAGLESVAIEESALP